MQKFFGFAMQATVDKIFDALAVVKEGVDDSFLTLRADMNRLDERSSSIVERAGVIVARTDGLLENYRKTSEGRDVAQRSYDIAVESRAVIQSVGESIAHMATVIEQLLEVSLINTDQIAHLTSVLSVEAVHDSGRPIAEQSAPMQRLHSLLVELGDRDHVGDLPIYERQALDSLTRALRATVN